MPLKNLESDSRVRRSILGRLVEPGASGTPFTLPRYLASITSVVGRWFGLFRKSSSISLAMRALFLTILLANLAQALDAHRLSTSAGPETAGLSYVYWRNATKVS